jgi:hypothetical protein
VSDALSSWRESFAAESLYTPDQWYVDELVELGEQRVVGICDTSKLVDHPLVLAQRPWLAQPKHIPGAVMVQITGTLGNIHAVLCLGLRMSEGWAGFGTNILDAKFRGLGQLGPALQCELTVEESRELRGTRFVTYVFRYQQDGRTIYTSRQRASWLRAEGSGAI